MDDFDYTVIKEIRPKTYYNEWPHEKPWDKIDDSLPSDLIDSAALDMRIKTKREVNELRYNSVGLQLFADFNGTGWNAHEILQPCCNRLATGMQRSGHPFPIVGVGSMNMVEREYYIIAKNLGLNLDTLSLFFSEYFETIVHHHMLGDFFHHVEWGVLKNGYVHSFAVFKTANRPAPLLLSAMTLFRQFWEGITRLQNYVRLRKEGFLPLDAVFFFPYVDPCADTITLSRGHMYPWSIPTYINSWKQQVGLIPWEASEYCKTISAWKDPKLMTYNGTARWGNGNSFVIKKDKNTEEVFSKFLFSKSEIKGEHKMVPFFSDDVISNNQNKVKSFTFSEVLLCLKKLRKGEEK